jgi:anti-sigma B factor antagonist
MSEGGISDQLVITRRREGEARVLALHGELDLASAPLLERALEDAENGGDRHLVVDLGGLEFVDARGLRVLLAARERSRQNGHALSLRGASQTVRRVFELTQTIEQFRFDG